MGNNYGDLPAIQVTLYRASAGKTAEMEEARRVGQLSFVDLAGSERGQRWCTPEVRCCSCMSRCLRMGGKLSDLTEL